MSPHRVEIYSNSSINCNLDSQASLFEQHTSTSTTVLIKLGHARRLALRPCQHLHTD